ncbi:MAG: histidine kinase [Actinomycetota bacterium]|nr:histidine kinase [Actinomycetota bacterium]
MSIATEAATPGTAAGGGVAVRPAGRFTSRDRVFAVAFAAYALMSLGALAAGLVSATAIPVGWHDALHDLGFVYSAGLIGRSAQALADAAHNTQPVAGLIIDYGFSLFNLALAGFLMWLRPRDRTARLLAVALVGTAAIFNLQAYSVYEALDAELLETAIHIGFHAVAAVAYALALLLFADGSVIPRWSRGRLALLYAPLVAGAVMGAVAIRGTSRVLAIILIFGLVTPAVGVAAQAYRYRTARTDADRLQARTLFWALLPALLLGVYVLQRGVAGSAFEAYQGRPLDIIPVALFRVFQPVFALIPAALFVGLVRFRLWNIDRVITRTLVYGALAGFVTVVYVGVVVGLGRLVGAQGNNLALSVLATGVVAVAFEPSKERLKTVANRLVYGRRATPYEVLADFSEQMAESVTTDEKLSRMAQILATGTTATRADVWLVVGGELRPAAAWPGDAQGSGPVRIDGGTLPELPDTTAAVAVRHNQELLGALSVTLPGQETLAPIEERLLRALADQAGQVFRTVRLTAELLDRLDDLRASRKRLVAAQDEARRRLERNLHDGAQQQLVALKVKLALAERLAEQGKPVGPFLHQLGEDTADAIVTLRDLARGIYPPLLADRGLAAALEGQAAKAAVAVHVDARDLGRYPQDAEAAVYFCCLEALQNIAKYADATAATVRLRDHGDRLVFSVTDDGRGFDPVTTPRGAGLQNMADRLDAQGGGLEVHSQHGRGTTLSGFVPVRRLDA